MMKLGLDRGEVGENIRMVVFEVIDDRRFRAVMNELGPLVEKGRVILICLDHKIVATTQPRGEAKVGGDPADQKPGLKSGLLQNPGQHAGGTGFAMGARDGEHPLILKNMTTEPFRPRGIGDPAVQHRLDDRLTTGQRVADHHTTRRGRELLGIVAVDKGYIAVEQLSAHGGINIAVRTRDRKTRLAGQQRQTAHKRAANTENVNVIGQGGSPRWEEIITGGLPMAPARSTVRTFRQATQTVQHESTQSLLRPIRRRHTRY